MDSCAICLEDIQILNNYSESIKTLRCNHKFHKYCIEKWVNDFHWVCPLCRNGIFELIVKKSTDLDYFSIHIDDKEYQVMKKDYWKVRVDLNLVPYNGTDELHKTYESQIVGIVFFGLIKNNHDLEKAKSDIRKFLLHLV
jgi:hypothetical protein